MIKLPLQFERISGPGADLQYRITFTVDESQRQLVKAFLDFRKGTELIADFYSGSTDREPMSAEPETEKETIVRFKKMFEAKIGEYAKLVDRNHSVVRDKIKELLKKKNLIKESTTELTVSGLSEAIAFVDDLISKVQ